MPLTVAAINTGIQATAHQKRPPRHFKHSVEVFRFGCEPFSGGLKEKGCFISRKHPVPIKGLLHNSPRKEIKGDKIRLE